MTVDRGLIGARLAEVQTPALILDLDALEFNLARLPQIVGEIGTPYRAHAKGHKSIEIARRQVAAGSVGICCQKISEVEVFAAAGIEDILLTNEIVDPVKLARACAVARGCRLTMVVDSAKGIALLNEASRQVGIVVPARVEVNLGQDRCGAGSAEEVLELVEAVQASNHLRYDGLQAYHGKLQHVSDWNRRRQEVAASTERLKAVIALLESCELAPPVISGGGTGTFEIDCELGVINELQPGSYIVMDAQYNAIGTRSGGRYDEFRNAIYVLTQVISRSGDNWCIVDAGLKALGSDAGAPTIVGLEAPFAFAGDEHGSIDLVGLEDGPAIGDRLRIVPGHCDTTINLHDQYVIVKDECVVDLWKVDARGCIQ